MMHRKSKQAPRQKTRNVDPLRRTERLKQVLAAEGLNGQDLRIRLAERGFPYSTSSVYGFLRGDRPVPLAFIEAAAGVLRVRDAWLRGADDDPGRLLLRPVARAAAGAWPALVGFGLSEDDWAGLEDAAIRVADRNKELPEETGRKLGAWLAGTFALVRDSDGIASDPRREVLALLADAARLLATGTRARGRSRSRRTLGSAGLAVLVILLALLTACTDLTGSESFAGPGTGDPMAPTTPPTAPLASVRCSARVDGTPSLTCGVLEAAGGASRVVVGGQGANVRLSSSAASFDSTSGVFGADIVLRNLRMHPLGTDGRGAGAEGVAVFFASLAVTEGSGTAEVLNADGVGDFTGSAQPFHAWPGVVLQQGEATTPKRWLWRLSPSVRAFAFVVYVAAPVLPVVVFDRVVDGNRDVWRVALDGSGLVRLTTNASDDRDPTVARGRIVYASTRDGRVDLYSVAVDGGEETRLTDTPSLHESGPALSPDGTRLAFARTDSDGPARVYVAAADASGAVPVTDRAGPESDATWQSSTRLAITLAWNGSADVYALTPGGGEPSLLAGGPASETEPTWSADGRRVVFASNRHGDTELYLLEVETGAVRRLTSRSGTDAAPAFLSDGRVVYVCSEANTPRLCWLDPDVPGSVTVIPTGPGAARRPAAVPY